jgi:hypothetical protein
MTTLICIKSESIFFPIRGTTYLTVEGKEYLIAISTVSVSEAVPNAGQHYCFLSTESIDDLMQDYGYCRRENFITLAEWREQQIKTILDE